MTHRAEAQKLSGITAAQQAGLSKGRAKGTNHRTGYQHKDESRRKASESHKAWCAANPERVVARGEKVRAEAHYRWKGGASKLNMSIRQMSENRRWMDAIKARKHAVVLWDLENGLTLCQPCHYQEHGRMRYAD